MIKMTKRNDRGEDFGDGDDPAMMMMMVMTTVLMMITIKQFV